MTDPVKQFLREFYSPLQHLRIMRFIEYSKEFWRSFKWK